MSDKLKESKSAVQRSAFSVQPCLSERGATLVELMFGVAIAMAVMGAGYTVLNSSQKAASTNSQTAEMQQSARVAMELLTQDLKTAGFGMSGSVGGCANAIMPADNTPGGADVGPDSVSVVVPTLLSTLAAQVAGGPTANAITLQSGAVAAMTPDGFGVGATVSINGALPGTVSGIAGDVLTLGNTVAAPAVFPADTPVFWLRCITYAIGTTAAACAGSAPCLLRGGVAIAEGIEDLQVAYACDGCNGTASDGVIDDQNASNTFDAADFISNSTWTTSPMTPDTIRLVRISIVARQTHSDSKWSSTAPIVAEDHSPTSNQGFSLGTYQQSRRRLLTRTVQVRNLGL